MPRVPHEFFVPQRLRIITRALALEPDVLFADGPI